MLTNLLIILLAVLGGYFLVMSRVAKELPRVQQWTRLVSFTLGLLVALLVFIPSPDFFGPDHRFTVSMAQMLLALDVAPVLLFPGIPSLMLQPLLRWERLGRLIRNPLYTGIVSLALLLIWFFPFFFGAASSNLTTWMLKQALFIVSGLIFWWPVAGPLSTWRPPPIEQLAYLFVMKVPMFCLGLWFAIADGLIYLSRSFALEICAPSSVFDQQIGGMIIMTVGGLFLFIAFTVVFFRWAAFEEAKDRERSENRMEENR